MSWWAGKTRDEFMIAAPAEQKRMAYAGNRPQVPGENQTYATFPDSEGVIDDGQVEQPEGFDSDGDEGPDLS